jgi:hypothetical protein
VVRHPLSPLTRGLRALVQTVCSYAASDGAINQTRARIATLESGVCQPCAKCTMRRRNARSSEDRHVSTTWATRAPSPRCGRG